MRILKRLLLTISTAAIVMTGIIGVHSSFISGTKAEAADEIPTNGSSFDVFIDSDNNVCIITNDQIRSSNIYYRTEGFFISRGKYNPSKKELENGKSTDYIYLPINDTLKVTRKVGSREINIFKYPFSTIKSEIASQATAPNGTKWLQEIDDAEKRGAVVYIRFDAKMFVYQGKKKIPVAYINNPPHDGENPAKLQGAYPWRAGTKTGIASHYNRWLPISSSKAPTMPSILLTDWHVTPWETIGPGVAGTNNLKYYGDYTGDPEYAGGNANLDGYDAGYGVPSTKTITGYTETSPWYGNIDVWARLVMHQYEKTDTYEWRIDKEKMSDDLTVTYDGKGIKDTGKIIAKVNEALDKIEELIKKEEERIKPLLAKYHDTDLEDVFTYTLKLRYVDDAGKVLANIGGADKDGNIVITVHNNVPTRVVPIPKWQNGWTWTTFDGYYKKGTGNYDENGNEIMEDDYNNPIHTPHSVTWTDHTKPEPKPTGDNIIAGPTATYTNGSLAYCGWKLWANVTRIYWDDEHNGDETTHDNYIEAYASFEYLDPYKTNIYDLNSATLYNDIYGSMSFSQVIDTKTDAQKGSIKTDNTVSFDTWFEKTESAAEISSKDIATSDYIEWATVKDEEKGRLEYSYREEDAMVKEFITQNTKSINDYIYVDNIIDKGVNKARTDQGVYLGNNDKNEYGVIKGCDFRDAVEELQTGEDPHLVGYESIDLEGLTGNIVTGDEVYAEGNDISRFWYLCKHAAGGNKEKANAYTPVSEPDEPKTVTDFSVFYGKKKLPGVIKVWEKLGYQTTAINPQTANGKHTTGISTLYAQEIIGTAISEKEDNVVTAPTTMQFADDVETAHLYSPTDVFGTAEYTSHGYSVWGGVKATSEGGMDASGTLLSGPSTVEAKDVGSGMPSGDVSYIVGSVQIHTPVMSPGEINDPSGKKTSREAGEINTNPVTGEETPTSSTNLYKDISQVGTSQLRLDSVYYIRWQDLSELIKKHRIAPTPEDGGYEEETDDTSTAGLEEDEYTKDKYFKFPFEVMYDGKFYKANQWIKIKSPKLYDKDGNAEESDDGYLRDANPHQVKEGDTDGEVGELISENHWVYTPFYIPSWAKEGLYEEIENPDPHNPTDLTTCAQLRVDAINVTETDASGNVTSRADKLQELANDYYNIYVGSYYGKDGAAYIAQFNYPVQLSGWIYDFTITGTSDIDAFGDLTEEEITSTDVFGAGEYAYSFTANKQDKKSGTYNRLGYKAIRYLKDGLVNKKWDEKNTVALVGAYKSASKGYKQGKSNLWAAKGAVVKGTTFSFTLKTMSNMWNFKLTDSTDKDCIYIRPTFTYNKYNKDTGTWDKVEHEDLRVYYDDGDNMLLIPYGSLLDQNTVKSAALGDKQFDESYYTETDKIADQTFGDWIWYNVYQYDLRNNLIPATMTLKGFKKAYKDDPEALIAAGAILPGGWLETENMEYCASYIHIPERMRLLSGEYEQLMFNIMYNGKTARKAGETTGGVVTYEDLAGSDYGYEYVTSINDKNEYSCTAKDPDIIVNGTKEKITMANKMRYSIQSWYGKYYIPEALYVVNLKEHPEFRSFDDEKLKKESSPKFKQWYDKFKVQGYLTGEDLGTPGDTNYYKDYMEYYITKMYVNGSTASETDDVFIQDGFLGINFDIVAFKDRKEHLVYKGVNNGSWKTEGYIEVPDDLEEPVPGKTDEGSPTDEGDVVVVDLSRKFSDRFHSAIFNTN